MYGINRPMGLVPYQTVSGDKGIIEIIRDRYEIENGYNLDIGLGAAVTLDGNGYVVLLPDYTPGTQTGPTNKILGVFQGCTYTLPPSSVTDAPLQKSEFWTGGTRVAEGTKIYAHLIIDPDIIYSIQTNEQTRGVERSTALFANANLIQSGSSAASKRDKVTPGYLDSASFSKEAGGLYYHLKVIGVDNRQENDWGTEQNPKPYNNVLVTINNHFLRRQSGQNS